MAEPTQNPSGLRHYDEIVAERRAAQNQEQAGRSVLERLKDGLRSWFTGESQLDEKAEKPVAHSALEAKQHGLSHYTSLGTTFVMPAEKQPKELRRYEDVLAGRHDGPKYQYGESSDAQSQSTPASQLKPYQPQR